MKHIARLFILLFMTASCQKTTPSDADLMSQADSLQWQMAGIYGNGKWKSAIFQEETYRETPSVQLPFPWVDSNLTKALEYNLELLDNLYTKGKRKTNNPAVSPDQLEEITRLLLRRQYQPGDLYAPKLKALQLNGTDNLGHVRFTGYYLPVMAVSLDSLPDYPWPVYRRPPDSTATLPERQAIVSNAALAGKGLEIAWAKSKVDIYYAQVQGSAIGMLPDGSFLTLAWDGSNRHPYRSIEKYLRTHPEWVPDNVGQQGIRKFLEENPLLVDSVLNYNPSFTFFTLQQGEPPGAGTVPLTPLVSVAADPDFIPLGSILLAALPELNPRTGLVAGHRFQLLIAQDIGGLIKGSGRIDLFQGTGPEANKKANRINHFGRVWILVPAQ